MGGGVTEMPINGFDVSVAAQAAAFFARKEGGRIDYLKLVKLMYLAEREFMDRYLEPLYYDEYVNMEHGPAPSAVINFIKGRFKDARWSKYLHVKSDTIVENRSSFPLDHLSEAALGVLGDLWKHHGHRGGFELRDWIHENCDEWRIPKGKSENLSHRSIFEALNKPDPDALAEDVEQHRELQRALSGG